MSSVKLHHASSYLGLVATNHTVLVCDDAPYMRKLVGRILEQGGYEVIGEAETGREAVEKYQILRPDLVTMDLVMRELGGLDAVRAIKEFDPKARILVCSAMAQQRLVAEVLAAGASNFVVKPFQPSHLLEAVQHALA
jgi:two-component system chemotaxis response regulator CheY